MKTHFENYFPPGTLWWTEIKRKRKQKLSLTIAGSQLTLINTAKGKTCPPTPVLFTVLKIQGAINILEGGVGRYPHLGLISYCDKIILSLETVIFVTFTKTPPLSQANFSSLSADLWWHADLAASYSGRQTARIC